MSEPRAGTGFRSPYKPRGHLLMQFPENAHTADVIEVGKQFYIKATSSLADDRTSVLLHGDTFAVFDRSGDIHPLGLSQQGIYYKETRHLSRVDLRVCGVRPL